MSIFPKRTLPGTTVTIHWNFNTRHLRRDHAFPILRLGVQAPDGSLTLLFEGPVLALPAVTVEAPQEEESPLYLNKNTPLLVLADYLSTHHKRELLVDILEHIRDGRHYYFHYPIAADAPLGKYLLVSEVYSQGVLKRSTTAADDFFFVEKVTVKEGYIINHSPENTPVKLIAYRAGQPLYARDVEVLELEPLARLPIDPASEERFLVYNEERELLPLSAGVRCLRNPRILPLEQDGKLHLLLYSGEAYTLRDEEKNIWDSADGLANRNEIRHPGNDAIYEEMIRLGLIIEINYPV